VLFQQSYIAGLFMRCQWAWFYTCKRYVRSGLVK